MSGEAVSFEVRSERPERVIRTILDRSELVRGPRAGILFISGPLVAQLDELASALAARAPGFPWLLAGGVGLLTERGELEHQSGAAGLIVPGVRAGYVVDDTDAGNLGERVREALAASSTTTALALMRADRFDQDALHPLGEELSFGRRVFGGGTVGDQDVFVVDGKEVRRGRGAALTFAGLGMPRIAVTPACRLLSPLEEVTGVRGSMVLEIAGRSALDALSDAARGLEDRPLVLLAVAAPEMPPREGLGSAPPGRRPELLLRAIQGVDPGRGGVLIGEELHPGTRVAYAVRDAAAARSDLESQMRVLALSAAGTAPRFGIYINCAGRGAGLYGVPDVDVKLVRARFPEMPLVGLQSAFEIGPFGSGAALHLYTGVLALFSAPS